MTGNEDAEFWREQCEILSRYIARMHERFAHFSEIGHAIMEIYRDCQKEIKKLGENYAKRKNRTH